MHGVVKYEDMIQICKRCFLTTIEPLTSRLVQNNNNQDQTASCASVFQANYWISANKVPSSALQDIEIVFFSTEVVLLLQWSCQVGGVDEFPAVKNAEDISRSPVSWSPLAS